MPFIFRRKNTCLSCLSDNSAKPSTSDAIENPKRRGAAQGKAPVPQPRKSLEQWHLLLSPWSTHPLSFAPAEGPSQSGLPPPNSLSPSPFPRYGHTLCVTSTLVAEFILFGGLVGDLAQHDVYLISPLDESIKLLTTTGDAPAPRLGHASIILGNKMVVWGGDTRLVSQNMSSAELDSSLYVLNLVTREWLCISTAGPEPPGRYGHTISMVGAKLYIFGGQINDRFTNDIWSFDLTYLQAGPQWCRIEPTKESPRPPKRTGHISVTYGFKVIIFGGTDYEYHYNDIWLFDTLTYEWTEIQCTPFTMSPREGHAAAIVDDMIYIFGGRGVDGKDLGDLGAFHIPTQRWYTFQNMGSAPSARSGHAMISVDDRVFVVGGFGEDTKLSDYIPLMHVLQTRNIKFPAS